MSDLKDSIDDLHDLARIRSTAIELRDQGLRSLRLVRNTTKQGKPEWEPLVTSDPITEEFCNRWTCSGSKAEMALLVKVQRRYYLSHNEPVNEASQPPLLEKLEATLTIQNLLPLSSSDHNEVVPVLLAARALSTLAVIPRTVFSETSMFCYYRIVRELYYADYPDWTIGGARAGQGGRTSAFITGECIRAIMALEAAVRKTAYHLHELQSFYSKHTELSEMLNAIGSAKSLENWASHAFGRMWLDWYISTHSRRNRAISLDTGKGSPTKDLDNRKEMSDRANRDSKFKALIGFFKDSLEREEKAVGRALAKIEAHRNLEINADGNNRTDEDKKLEQRTASAHHKAVEVLERVKSNATKLLTALSREGLSPKECFSELHDKFRRFPEEIHRVLGPATIYIDSVLDRELSLAHARSPFDAGELTFAAAAYGAVTKWQDNEKLRRVCEHVVTMLPENGRVTSTRAFHADKRGYKRFPAACDTTRSFAKLLERTGYEFEPSVARRMIQLFLNDKQFFRSSHELKNQRCAGWNFENAPDFEKPCVWVTAIAVQALDRVVRMLNSRINEEVFQHFKVVKPSTHETQSLTLDKLIYPDHGIVHEDYPDGSIANRLERMRAHIMGVQLPDKPREVRSAVLYGPPATGKTSLLEALASSAHVPLVMLSPSDLIVQGQEQLEGRARVVFDALSMLTRAVILLDEFEPAVYTRTPKSNKRQQRPVQAVLRFLVTGMLPKLKTLHDAARNQSLVYCLATNHLEQIDVAAKRPGRFDIQQAVYLPDPLSRAGTFLFAFNEKLGNDPNSSFSTQERDRRIAKIVAATAFTNARELGEKFKPQDDGTNMYVDFLIHDAHAKEIEKLIKEAEQQLQKALGDLAKDKDLLEDSDREIRESLLAFEKKVSDHWGDVDFTLDDVLTRPVIRRSS